MRFSYRKFLVFLLLFSCFLVPNRDYSLRGNIYQADDQPLPGVVVNEFFRGRKIGRDEMIISDGRGYYETNFGKDDQDCVGVNIGDFMFRKEGYKDFTISLEIDDDIPKTLNVIMERTDSEFDSRIKEDTEDNESE